MKKEYEFWSIQSGKVFLTIEEDKIRIKRKGVLSFSRYGIKGEKTILIRNISGIQLKEPGITVGYLQFVIIGSQESKGGLQAAMKDENTIVFGGGFNDKEATEKAKEIKYYIEKYLEDINNNGNNNQIQSDKYDKLLKIKKLKEEGILTEEEYEAEKQNLLKAEN